MSDDPFARAYQSLNRLAKWRSVFTGWQLGTRPRSDPEAMALRDHREITILMRAEINVLIGLLVDAKIFDADEFTLRLGAEAEHLMAEYEAKFPGFHATDDGISMDMPEAAETMRKMNWPA